MTRTTSDRSETPGPGPGPAPAPVAGEPTDTGAPLSFSTRGLRAKLTAPGTETPLQEETLVVNLSAEPLDLGTERPSRVAPLQSAVLDRVTLRHPAPLLLLTGLGTERIDGLGAREGWLRIGNDPAVAAGAGEGEPFPAATPLWRSPIAQLGTVTLPAHLLGAPSAARTPVPLKLQANLWYAPAGTDCHIHRRHDFLEVHTQVAGRGRMQKFHAQDARTRYQDVALEPGSTHAPFCGYDATGAWSYPWHRYWAESDCVWLALEYHPC
ncbi:hypothetical protein ACFRMQ_26020 [Kitasatospora sp. NPDC056783]|uniref:hypothetical protein n=1 Tax=Kitasatospora sp. NPDC056783 TaxID=3345943 RepID=UPI0036CD0CEA